MRLLLPYQLMASTTIRKTSLAQLSKDPSVLPMHCCQTIADSPVAETGFDLSSAWRNLESGEARNSVAPWFSKTRDYTATLA